MFGSTDPMFKKDSGRQYAPMHVLFTVKQEDLRHKARFVANENVIDGSRYIKYSPTVKLISVQIFFFIIAAQNFDLMTVIL